MSKRKNSSSDDGKRINKKAKIEDIASTIENLDEENFTQYRTPAPRPPTPIHSAMFPLSATIKQDPEDVPRFLPRSAYEYVMKQKRYTSKNQTGYTGVRYNTNGLRYRATVSHKGRGINAGTFDSPELAAFSYDLLQLELKKEATLIKRLNFSDFWIGRINANRKKAGMEMKEKKHEYRCIRDYLKVDRTLTFKMGVVYDFTKEQRIQVEGKDDSKIARDKHIQHNEYHYLVGNGSNYSSSYMMNLPPMVLPPPSNYDVLLGSSLGFWPQTKGLTDIFIDNRIFPQPSQGPSTFLSAKFQFLPHPSAPKRQAYSLPSNSMPASVIKQEIKLEAPIDFLPVEALDCSSYF